MLYKYFMSSLFMYTMSLQGTHVYKESGYPIKSLCDDVYNSLYSGVSTEIEDLSSQEYMA